MFWYTLIKTSELEELKEYKVAYLEKFKSDQQFAEIRREEKKALKERIKSLEKARDDLLKDIPHYGWLIWDIQHKRATDKQLKAPKNNILPEWITYDMIEHWIIDRKQGKIAILLK